MYVHYLSLGVKLYCDSLPHTLLHTPSLPRTHIHAHSLTLSLSLALGVKLYCAPMAKRVADRAIQVLGGNGYVAEYKVIVCIIALMFE